MRPGSAKHVLNLNLFVHAPVSPCIASMSVGIHSCTGTDLPLLEATSYLGTPKGKNAVLFLHLITRVREKNNNKVPFHLKVPTTIKQSPT